MLDGRKKFDVRINDRRPRYAVGQTIVYKEWAANGFTGRELKRRIIFVQPGYEIGFVAPLQGIRNGWVGLGLEEIDDPRKT